MENKYAELENSFDCACKDVVKKLSEVYKSDYQMGGPGKLNTFLDLIQQEFDAVETKFVGENNLSSDSEALHAVRSIAKAYAKRCVEDYGKVA